ncbi:MAG: hypothetical protein JXB88_09955 [Spirochaetales bacterium]|nr:hypothetical protein [Spirochaetales bacterium]
MKKNDLFISLNNEIKSKGNFTLIKKEIQKSLTRLKEREMEILKMRYGLDGYKRCTLNEVGKQFNITAERVRQIQILALKKLRTTMDLGD